MRNGHVAARLPGGAKRAVRAWTAAAALLLLAFRPAGERVEGAAAGAGTEVDAPATAIVPTQTPAPTLPLQAAPAGDLYPHGLVRVRAYGGAPVPREAVGVLATGSGHLYAPLPAVAGAEFVIVEFGPGRASPARLLAGDGETQIALLRATRLPSGGGPAPVLGDAAIPGVRWAWHRGRPIGARQEPAPLDWFGLGSAGPLRAPATVHGMRERVGPLTDVLEVSLPAGAAGAGGVLLDRRGRLVGLAVAEIGAAPGSAPGGRAGARLLVVPAEGLRRAVERILIGVPRTDTFEARPLSAA